jgi:hypothetical protein
VSVTVSPESFTFVDYDHGRILDMASQAAKDAQLPDDCEVSIEVVESSPLGRLRFDGIEPGPPTKATLYIDGGALEDFKAPRQLDSERAREILGRGLIRVADVVDPAFGFSGDPESLSVPRQVAWDTYAVGRLSRLGYRIKHERWLYLWRNRHGFTDDSDLAFESLWQGEKLTWDEIRSASEGLKPDSEVLSPRRVRTR